jgi:SAM-dependent methyltransferase
MILFILYWKVFILKKIEFIKCLFFYFLKNLKFLGIELCFFAAYFFKNAYRVNKEFLLNRGEKNPYVYGETPLTTFDKIARECQLLSSDTVIELGCGTGRTSFWLATFVKCQVKAIDYVPQFIQNASRIKRLFPLSNLHFLCEDFMDSRLAQATCIYLYGTCLTDSQIETLIQKFSVLPAGTKIISVSFSLADYRSSLFTIQKVFTASFYWGKTEVYLNLRNQL